MKTYNLFFALALSVAPMLNAGSVTNAIKRFEVEHVKTLLESKKISAKTKEKYLKQVDEISKALRIDTKKRLWHHSSDFGMVSAGLGLEAISATSAAVFGLLVYFLFDTVWNDEKHVNPVMPTAVLSLLGATSITTGWFGCKQIRKGWNLHSVYTKLVKLNEIKKFINDFPATAQRAEVIDASEAVAVSAN